jgi:hypothetical protein
MKEETMNTSIERAPDGDVEKRTMRKIMNANRPISDDLIFLGLSRSN